MARQIDEAPTGSLADADYILASRSTDARLERIPGSDFATGAEGVLAVSALQPADINTLAELNAIVADATLGTAADFATAAQGSTADSALQAADINTLAELNAIVADATLVDGALANVVEDTSPQLGGNLDTQSFTVDGRDVSVDGSKLDGIEAGSTADQSNAEIRAAVEAATDSNVFTDADHTKLDGVESSATADQTATEIGVAVHLVGLDAAKPAAASGNNGVLYLSTDVNGGTTYRSNGSTWVQAGGGVTSSGMANVVEDTSPQLGANLDTQSFTVDGRDVSVDGTKLDGVEAGATADQSNAEIRAAVEAATDSNVFTDADHSKLNGVEANATADQTATEIGVVVHLVGLDAAKPAAASANNGVLYLSTDVNGGTLYRSNGSSWVAAGGGVTSSGMANVVEDTSPQLGGMLDINGQAIGDGTLELLKFSETVSAVNEITVTNAATGGHPSITATGDDANPDLVLDAKGTGVVKTLSSNLNITGDIVVSGVVDGRDVATDGTKLDGVASGATNNTGALADLSTVAAGQIDDEAVTLAKMAHMATGSLLGRDTALTGDVEVLSKASALTLLNVADGSTANDSDANLKNRANHTGTQTLATISDSAALAALATVGTTEIDDEAVTLPKLTHIATDSFLGRTTALTGDVEVLSAADVRTILNVESGATADQSDAEIRAAVEAATDSNVFTDADHSKLNGIEASATADQSNAEIRAAVEAATDSNVFTDADHTKLDGVASSATANDTDPNLKARANHTGTQPLSTISDSGALAALATVGTGQIDDEAVTHAKLAHMATDSFLGRTTAGTGDVETLSASQARTVLNVADGAEVNPTEAWTVALGDETTAITTGTAKVTFRTPYAMTVTGVRASLTTASSSGIPTFDINEGGSTILTTKLTIDANEKTSTTAVTAAVIGGAGPVLADDAEITIDVDVAGTGAAGAKITLLYTR